MPRILTQQAASAKPVRVALTSIPTDWTTILDAPDFSVPDTLPNFPNDRDPTDPANRRIQPGFALVLAPLMIYNSSGSETWVEIRILTESGDSILQARQTIPGGETYLHPAPGQRLLKTQIATANGDRLQVRAQAANVLSLTGSASEGAAEQHQPVRAA
ncbi:MAG: hypothetical protein L0G27_08200 [Paracoccus sp. (in: a-proteobacteria)]|nr:hypothetical protein [Paracoccus sp. (in: a-proteobacteria)]